MPTAEQAQKPVVLVVDDLKDSYESLVEGLRRYKSGRLADEFEFDYAGSYAELKDWYSRHADRFVALIVQDVDFSHVKDERKLVGYSSSVKLRPRAFDPKSLQGLLIYGNLRQENVDRVAPVVFVSSRVGVESTSEFAEFMVNPGFGSCTFVPEDAVGVEYYPKIAETIDTMALRPLSEERRRYWRDHHEMVMGRSRKMALLAHEIENIGPSDAIVLLIGQPGVGKELVARALHRCSSRYIEGDPQRKYPCTVNMAALDKNLVLDDLFGHEKGAYTDASGERAGIFEAARDSTAFLDEIGEIDRDIQTKLLRVMEYYRIKRLGSSFEIDVRTRIIATTNRSIDDLQRRFRPDFYTRLVQHCLPVPSLRDRWDGEPTSVIEYDLEQMFDFVVEEMNRDTRHKRQVRMERTSVRFVRQLVEEYMDGSNAIFDGNVRTLRNIIQRAYERAQYDGSSEIGLGHIMPTLAFFRLAQSTAAPAGRSDVTLESVTGTLNLDRITDRAIDEAMAKTHDRITDAARLLGINRETLRRKLNERSAGSQPTDQPDN